MILSRYNLKKINTPGLQVPDEDIFQLPEKVLQFGAGVLLRGLPDYFIDKANRKGLFNGRVVVVKSTNKGSAADFGKQDSLYTIYLKGIANSVEVKDQVICSAISRVLSATEDWSAVLDVARSPELKVVISNTTEVGIQFMADDVRKHPPVSYPGKLLAVLYARYHAFKGSEGSGLIIIPTELITDNGKKLEAIVLELAHLNKLEPAFMDWLEKSNKFCDSLVDRIVPGRPGKVLEEKMDAERGYTDDFNIIAEPYSLWAIEGPEELASVLTFIPADRSVIITPDITLFRELKIRLLNGTHTLSCAVAIISGFNTVKESMDDALFSNFVSALIFDEIIPAIPYKVNQDIAEDYAKKVLDRFGNPYIRHEWLSIAAQYSTKIKTRVLPLLLNHYKLNNAIPPAMAHGFAAFLRFMNVKQTDDGQYIGSINNKKYILTDNNAAYFFAAWTNADIKDVVESILKNRELWENDLTAIPGFSLTIADKLKSIIKNERPNSN